MPVLHGDGLTLRPVEPGDARALRAIHLTPQVTAWWGPMDPGFPDDEPGATRFALVVDGALAGLVQYGEQLEPMYRHAWIDLFVDPALHGSGIGTEAVRTMLRHLHDDRGHHRVTIDPALDNHAAVRAYEKAGFRRVGVMEAAEYDHAAGTWRDALLMEHVVLAGG